MKNNIISAYKTFSSNFKSMSSGIDITADILSKINKYALKELTQDDIYARKILLAHNLVDRDRERFSEKLLDDFASSLPGKSFLFAHDRGKFLPLGLFFDAKTEEMDPEHFASLTDETPKMGDEQISVKVLWAWIYIMKTQDNESIIANIEGGTYRHTSIGFSASDLAPVKGQYDQIIYWEYAAPGEATEGSLVWLGAQNGATTVKAAKEKYLKHQHKEKTMKTLIHLIGTMLGKTFGPDTSEEKLAEEVKSALDAKDQQVETLQTDMVALKTLAEQGKAFVKSLVDEYARLKALLKECDETEDAAKAIKAFASQMPVDFLQAEIKSLTKRAEENFPDTHNLRGDATRDKSQGGDEKENPLIPKEA